MTAPQPTPEAKERVEPSGLEVVAMPFFLKVGRFSVWKDYLLFLVPGMVFIAEPCWNPGNYCERLPIQQYLSSRELPTS